MTRRPDERTQRVGERVALGIEVAGVRHTGRVGRYILGVRDARPDLADLLGGQVRGVNDGGEPVVGVRLNEGALVAMCLGTKAPAHIGTGSGGRIWQLCATLPRRQRR